MVSFESEAVLSSLIRSRSSSGRLGGGQGREEREGSLELEVLLDRRR